MTEPVMALLSFGESILAVLPAEIRDGVYAAAIAGSTVSGGSSADGDIDLVVVTNQKHRQRLRRVCKAGVLDIIQENTESIASELLKPRRAALVELLATSEIFRDQADILGKAKQNALTLLSAPAPLSVFQTDFVLFESARDLMRRYSSGKGSSKLFVRGILLSQLAEIACKVLRIWPPPIHLCLSRICCANREIGYNLNAAIEGDDSALLQLFSSVVKPLTSVDGAEIFDYLQ